MRRPLLLALVLATLALALAPATADAHRCGDRVITRGQHDVEVRILCGAPLHVDRTVESRAVRTRLGDGSYSESRTYIPVERWVYLPGPGRLVTSLIFENGRFVRAQTEGHAPTGDPGPEQCRNSVHSPGDTAAEVLLRCGAPLDVYRWYEERAVGNRQGGTLSESRATVVRERWIYNLGPHRFLRIFHFVAGRLESETTGGYGF